MPVIRYPQGLDQMFNCDNIYFILFLFFLGINIIIDFTYCTCNSIYIGPIDLTADTHGNPSQLSESLVIVKCNNFHCWNKNILIQSLNFWIGLSNHVLLTRHPSEPCLVIQRKKNSNSNDSIPLIYLGCYRTTFRRIFVIISRIADE